MEIIETGVRFHLDSTESKSSYLFSLKDLKSLYTILGASEDTLIEIPSDLKISDADFADFEATYFHLSGNFGNIRVRNLDFCDFCGEDEEDSQQEEMISDFDDDYSEPIADTNPFGSLSSTFDDISDTEPWGSLSSDLDFDSDEDTDLEFDSAEDTVLDEDTDLFADLSSVFEDIP